VGKRARQKTAQLDAYVVRRTRDQQTQTRGMQPEFLQTEALGRSARLTGGIIPCANEERAWQPQVHDTALAHLITQVNERTWQWIHSASRVSRNNYQAVMTPFRHSGNCRHHAHTPSTVFDTCSGACSAPSSSAAFLLINCYHGHRHVNWRYHRLDTRNLWWTRSPQNGGHVGLHVPATRDPL